MSTKETLKRIRAQITRTESALVEDTFRQTGFARWSKHRQKLEDMIEQALENRDKEAAP